ncbi:NAD(P)/FAD-dependent oxidoreductase [Glutamicibacter sp. NPDC087344]|uniref:NAD(P)/FAD-dependent oxidoreductase n=1 Tax=Glutamicibacter sp. NPDC087344 TaxID=3363994 RepID=UPI0038037A8C
MNPETIVVIGAGLAAATLVRELRARGYDGVLRVIGDESALPYERPPLSKGFLQGADEVADFTVNTAAWYAENHVDLRLDTRAISIDRKHQHVVLADGTTIDYDALVLATGARSRLGGSEPMAGHDLPGVHLLRTLKDAQALKEQITDGTQVAVIGSGWIGMEVAASSRALGARVTVYSPDDLPLAKVFGERFGHHLLELHQRHGVDVRTGTRVQGIELVDRHLQVVSDAGSSRAEVVLLAIGAVPNVELAETAGLEVDRGVIVDASLRSSDSKILVIGDAAQAFNTRLRRQLQVEHWDNAIRQGKLAAATLLGADESYDWLPYFFTDQFDLGMEYVGDAKATDETVVRGTENEFVIFWLRERRITAAANVNIWDVNDTLRALVGREIDPARLADDSITLEEL